MEQARIEEVREGLSGPSSPQVTPTMIAALWRYTPVSYLMVVQAGSVIGSVLMVNADGFQTGLGWNWSDKDFYIYALIERHDEMIEWLTRLHRAAFGTDPVINPRSEPK